MDLFDRVGKTVSDVGQRTREGADIVRLNNKISENEKQMDQVYTRIGKLYFDLHGEDPEEAFVPDLTAVLELKAQNDEFNDQIQNLKGFVKCPTCGEYVANTEKICPHCGGIIMTEDFMYCPSCHATVEKENAFCPYCGTRLHEDEPKEPEPVEQPTKIICRCGAELDTSIAFCPHCGTRVADLIAEQEATAAAEAQDV